jgi:WD40 repeat protein
LHEPQLAFPTGHPVTAVALAPDGRALATGGQDGVIRLWDAATARELAALPGHPGGVSGLVFGADGRLASTGADERVRVWDTAAGRATHTLIQPTTDLHIAVSPDGGTLAVGGRQIAGVTLVDLAAGGKPRRFGEWAGPVSALTFDPTGNRIAAGYDDGMVRLWDPGTRQEVVRGAAGAGAVDAVAFDATGATLAVVLNAPPGADGGAGSDPAHEVVFLAARDGSVRDRPRPLAHPGPVTAVAFTPDGLVLTAAHDGNLYVWDAADGRVVRTVRGHADPVRGFAVAPDGTAVFSAGGRAARQWPMGTKENVAADQHR